MTVSEHLLPTRELIDGVYYRVDVSRDGRIRVNFGPDDQRPDADGVHWFVPIHVRQKDGLHRATYCGKCRRLMNGDYDQDRQEWRFCPRCGAGIAHWNWLMGDIEWITDWLKDFWKRMPDVLPEFGGESGFMPASAERKRLSSGTASDPESLGSGSVGGDMSSAAIAEIPFAKDGQ